MEKTTKPKNLIVSLLLPFIGFNRICNQTTNDIYLIAFLYMLESNMRHLIPKCQIDPGKRKKTHLS